MIKRKGRGFRLGRRLVRIWRWSLPRRRPRNYLRLSSGPLLSPYHSLNHERSATMATKLFQWGRCLTRRLRPSSLLECTSPRNLLSGRRYCRVDGEATALMEESKPPPKGHLAVYVGDEKDVNGGSKRYVVPIIHFNHPLFGQLLREAEAEYGFHHPGGITIPCPVSRFELVQTCIASAARRS